MVFFFRQDQVEVTREYMMGIVLYSRFLTATTIPATFREYANNYITITIVGQHNMIILGSESNLNDLFS